MKVNFTTQPFLIHSADLKTNQWLSTFISYNKGKKKGCKVLSDGGWGGSVISATRIIGAIDTTLDWSVATVEYEVKP